MVATLSVLSAVKKKPMPKHVPTFKHLLSTIPNVSPTDQKSNSTTSVNDLLSRSRISRPIVRDTPPHLRGNRVWSPSLSASVSDPSGLIDVENSGVHPAELLRRFNLSRRAASRSTAGPAPPPSWISIAPTSSSKKTRQVNTSDSVPVTTKHLRTASSLFSHPIVGRRQPSSHTGPPRLVEHCLQVVLNYLESEDLIEIEDEDGGVTNVSLGEVLRQQTAYLEPHLRSALLEQNAMLPEGDLRRMTDRSLRSLLGYNHLSISDVENQEHPDTDTDWESSSTSAITTIHHLPLTLHRSPLSILKAFPNLPLISLTSLNLSYSTLPTDLERLVTILPTGLRDLCLSGVKIAGKRVNGVLVHQDRGEEDWIRGFEVLGRRLIVLRFLDLSFPPFEISKKIIGSLLHPPNNHLPSLKLLGLRSELRHLKEDISTGFERSTTSRHTAPTSLASQNGGRRDEVVGGCLFNSSNKGRDEKRKLLSEVIRSGRTRWIDIVWD